MARFPGPSPARSRHRRPLGRPPHPVALRPGEPSLSFCAALQEGTTSHSSPQARCFPGNALLRASPRIHPPQLVILLPGRPVLRPPFAPSLPRCLAHSKCDLRLAPCPVTFSASPYSRNPNPAPHTSRPLLCRATTHTPHLPLQRSRRRSPPSPLPFPRPRPPPGGPQSPPASPLAFPRPRPQSPRRGPWRRPAAAAVAVALVVARPAAAGASA